MFHFDHRVRLRELTGKLLSTTWLTLLVMTSLGQGKSVVVSPKEHFGFELGEDRKLVDWYN